MRVSRARARGTYHAGVGDALRDLPLDPLVGPLRLDLGLELLRLAPDLRRELDRALVVLRDARDPVHELRPVLELGPLVVGGLDRHGHVDRLLHRHPTTLAHARHAALAATAVAAAEPRDQAARRVLDEPARAARLVDLLADDILELGAHPVPDLRRRLLGHLRRLQQRPAGAAHGADALHRERHGRGEPGARRDALGARERTCLRRLGRRATADVLECRARRVAERAAHGVAHRSSHSGSFLWEFDRRSSRSAPLHVAFRGPARALARSCPWPAATACRSASRTCPAHGRPLGRSYPAPCRVVRIRRVGLPFVS